MLCGTRDAVDDGWFNTRDAGRLVADGFLFVQGRLDDVIVRGGENLSPGEIEAFFLHSGVFEGKDAKVLSWQGPQAALRAVREASKKARSRRRSRR